MRSAYLKASKFLEPAETVTKEDVEDAVKTFTSKFLKIMGFSDSEITEMADLSDDELQRRIQEKRGMQLNDGHKQRVISLDCVLQDPKDVVLNITEILP